MWFLRTITAVRANPGLGDRTRDGLRSGECTEETRSR
jgi:hypothetical protein